MSDLKIFNQFLQSGITKSEIRNKKLWQKNLSKPGKEKERKW